MSIQARGSYDNDVGLLCFVTPEQASRIHAGDSAVVNGTPTTVKEVGGKAYTKDELANLLGSQYAASQFNSESEYSFIVALEKNPDTEVGAGGLVSASITVKTVSLVVGYAFLKECA